MWDAIAKVLTNSNALLVLVFLVIFFLLFVLCARTGLIQIKTAGFRMGADSRERDIIRQQAEWAYSFIMGLKSQIQADEKKYNGYLTRYVLERVYDEVVSWVVFNHINLESDYISIKQEKIKSIVLAMSDIDPKYKSKDFLKKIDKWVEEVIRKLVTIREVYK